MALYNSSSSSLSSTSQLSSPTASPRDSTTTMTRSPSAEPSKPTKRKGTRSVSTLTPSQLARKRANDREAQRAIRARTKEHIERLEREVEELKSKQNRDETLQELVRKNKALEKELMRLRESYGIPTSHPYPTPLYDDSGVSSRASSSFGQHSPDYHQVGEYGASYLPTPEPSEQWTSVLPCSNVSSPASSGTAEEYGYIPTSVPSRLEGLPPTSRVASADMKYEDMDNGEFFPLCFRRRERSDTRILTHSFRKRLPAGEPGAAASDLHAPAVMEHVPRLLPSVSGSLKPTTTPGPASPGRASVYNLPRASSHFLALARQRPKNATWRPTPRRAHAHGRSRLFFFSSDMREEEKKNQRCKGTLPGPSDPIW
ncbi:hypothetical protein RB594_002262 [Gaeumannomyces avenae]